MLQTENVRKKISVSNSNVLCNNDMHWYAFFSVSILTFETKQWIKIINGKKYWHLYDDCKVIFVSFLLLMIALWYCVVQIENQKSVHINFLTCTEIEKCSQTMSRKRISFDPQWKKAYEWANSVPSDYFKTHCQKCKMIIPHLHEETSLKVHDEKYHKPSKLWTFRFFLSYLKRY